jgi:hypothetical protein
VLNPSVTPDDLFLKLLQRLQEEGVQYSGRRHGSVYRGDRNPKNHD